MEITRRGLLGSALAAWLAGPRGASAGPKPLVTVHRSPT
jgi:hypothetical protein